MNADFNTLLTQWTFRPVLLLVLGAVVILYRRGYANVTDPEVKRRPRKFYASLLVLILATISPIHYLSNQFFFMRTLQHLMVISLFPATFMSADPLPMIFAGLPRPLQVRIAHFYEKRRNLILAVTPKGVVWFFFLASVWIWYDATLHAATLTYPGLRTFELLFMGVGALGHWWHVTAAHPRLHPRLPSFAHMGYTIAGAAPLKIPGLFLLFSIAVIYQYDGASFFGFALDPLVSQRMGGVVIWLFGGVVYSLTAVSYFSNWLSTEEDKPPQPIDQLWDNHETLIAPHLEK